MQRDKIIPQLILLYKEGKSPNQISQILQRDYSHIISKTMISYYLKKNNIALRNHKEASRSHIDVDFLIKKYREVKFVRKLSKELGISRKTINKILNENGLQALDNDTAIRLDHLKYPKAPFNGSDKEKAYIYGFVMGDVHAYKKSKFTLALITHSTHRTFVHLFTQLFSPYGNIMNKFRLHRNEWRLLAHVDYESFKFLLDRKYDNIPSWITQENFESFLAGFVDSDGTVMIKRAGKFFQLVIRLFGQDKDVLLEVQKRLDQVGFKSNLTLNFKAGTERMWKDKIMRYNKDYYVLEVSGKKAAIELLSNIPLRHSEKIERKKQMIEIYERNAKRWEEIKEEVMQLRQRLKSEALSRTTEDLSGPLHCPEELSARPA